MKTNFVIRRAGTPEEVMRCYPVMAQLRPQYSAQAFLAQVQAQMQEGFQLAYACEGDKVVTVAGFRLIRNLAWGRFLYVDDLVTDAQQRSRGAGQAMLAWLVEEARRCGCDQLHLDSGVQRLDAHRFYEREGMQRSSYHFAINLKND
ncbi:MAG: GNAT family N-acetyltransferase [Pseudomonadota bacterium]